MSAPSDVVFTQLVAYGPGIAGVVAAVVAILALAVQVISLARNARIRADLERLSLALTYVPDDRVRRILTNRLERHALLLAGREVNRAASLPWVAVEFLAGILIAIAFSPTLSWIWGSSASETVLQNTDVIWAWIRTPVLTLGMLLAIMPLYDIADGLWARSNWFSARGSRTSPVGLMGAGSRRAMSMFAVRERQSASGFLLAARLCLVMPSFALWIILVGTAGAFLPRDVDLRTAAGLLVSFAAASATAGILWDRLATRRLRKLRRRGVLLNPFREEERWVPSRVSIAIRRAGNAVLLLPRSIAGLGRRLGRLVGLS